MADQLLTAAMVHVFALAAFVAGSATLWAISRACRTARNGLRWCWRRCAVLEGFQFVGIEQDPVYAAIAEARIGVAQPGLPLGAIA